MVKSVQYCKNKMIDIEQDSASRHGTNEQTIIIEEYHEIVEDLKRGLHLCKVEQNNIRSELETLQNDNRNSVDIRESFNRIHEEECGDQDSHSKQIANLQERISYLQTEKDSALQLWHISLNTIDLLEEELKGFQANGKGAKYYQDQVNTLKETYSEAIKTLEGKLLQAKDNFLKQQAQCQASKEKIENMIKERDEVMHKFANLQRETQEKDRNNQLTIETLKKELSYARAEINKMMQVKLDLEKKLNEVKRFAENVVAKDRETKTKMGEAIELIETAVREKDMVLHREAIVLEEKARLEIRLNTIGNEYDTRIQEINTKTKEEIDLNTKKYLSEIKEIKAELREKVTLLEKTQRELRLSEDELGKIRRDSNAAILDNEQKLKRMELQLQVFDESKIKNVYDMEMTQLRQKITILEGKLSNSNDKLRKLEQQASVNMEHQVKRADRKTKDVMKQYDNLESQLAKTLGDKEDLVLQLKSLKHDFDYEIQKRDNERHSLEIKINELEMNLHKANCTIESKLRNNVVTEDQIPCLYDMKKKPTLDIKVENKCHCCQTVLSDHINKLQEKFDKKSKELKHHVQVHQKLSKKWRDEAKSLTTRFQGKTKELRGKMNSLQRENNELTKELLACKQQLSEYTIQDFNRCNDANEIR